LSWRPERGVRRHHPPAAGSLRAAPLGLCFLTAHFTHIAPHLLLDCTVSFCLRPPVCVFLIHLSVASHPRFLLLSRVLVTTFPPSAPPPSGPLCSKVSLFFLLHCAYIQHPSVSHQRAARGLSWEESSRWSGARGVRGSKLVCSGARRRVGLMSGGSAEVSPRIGLDRAGRHPLP